MASIPGFMVGWSAGAVLGVVVVMWQCRRAGLTGREAAGVTVALVVAVLVGTKGLYLAESWRLWWGVDGELWRLVASPRMRIPGGILLALLMCWPLARWLAVRPLWLADHAIPIAGGLCLAAVRAGCLLEGCCHGAVTSLPLAQTFPPETGAYLWQGGTGVIDVGASATLPVHPLQIYYAVSGLVLAVAAALYYPHRRYEGELIAWFALLYFSSSWLLDHLSAVPSPVTRSVCIAAAVLATVAIARQEWRLSHVGPGVVSEGARV